MPTSIIIANRRSKRENLIRKHPGFEIIDLTSKSDTPFVKFSPFFPVGDIPIPGLEGKYAMSVEGIWQGLKVFHHSPPDFSKFGITSMKGIKRTVRKFGTVKGHQFGEEPGEILSYIEARKRIYLPAYHWVLEEKLKEEVQLLLDLYKEKDVLFLDYETNGDINDTSKPLSHASLVRNRILQLTH